MKNYSFKPLYIFLAIVATSFILKLTMKPVEIGGISHRFEKKGKYVNSFEEALHTGADSIKNGIDKIKKEAAEVDSIAIIPTYK